LENDSLHLYKAMVYIWKFYLRWSTFYR